MKKNKIILMFIVLVFFFLMGAKLFHLNISKNTEYKEKLLAKTEIYVLGSSAPRGRILDRNGIVIVDNQGINSIIYNKIKGISVSEELSIAKALASMLSIEEAPPDELKEYWLLLNDQGKTLITKEEYQLLEERKITSEDINNYKLDRITEEMLNNFSDEDKKTAHIYSLMNEGYFYQKKVILENPSEEEYALVIESNIPGITGEMTWKRVYNYGETLRSILGSVKSIPKELSDEYLSLGYELTDLVGISYLEKVYEDYLKGTKAKYLVNKDYTLTCLSEAKRGNDLVLSIDIKKQLFIESTLQKYILEGKKYQNTEYYKDSYAILSDPSTGEIIAMSGQRMNSDETFSDITSNAVSSAFTVGSSVKGATISVGYKYNLITPDKYIIDSCVKLYLVPKKCSHDSLGKINDLTALAQSSNYYQYLIAINLVGKTYTPNMVLGATKEHFEIYRNTLKEFGLGSITGIDLPNETAGITGSTIADDLLLNLAIGQYDTYTPIQMLQYINTIATSSRIAPSLMKEIRNDTEVILEHEVNILNKLEIEQVYLDRIREGMGLVLKSGTGRRFVNLELNPIGKTGTSESFYDSDLDGKTDVATISNTFVGYFPKDNPKYSLIVITPNNSHKNGSSDYIYFASRRITRAITDFLFEN